MVGDVGAIRKCEQNQMNAREMKMLRWLQGKTIQDHIRSVVIWKKAHINLFNPDFLSLKNWTGQEFI